MGSDTPYQHRHAKHIILRLDNGSLIGDQGTLLRNSATGCVLLEAHQALECNRLGPADIERLKKLVEAAAPVESVANGVAAGVKHGPSFEAVQPPSKRQRTSEGAVPREPLGPPPSADWTTKCLRIVQQILEGLGSEAYIFRDPVDSKFVKDYYDIIKNPMCLSTIQKRLRGHHYQDPSQFCDDMRLIWSNCRIYNPRETHVGKLGLKNESRWEELWAGSGLATDATRARRATAGLAAEKFDPFDQPPAKTRSGPARSGAQRTAPGGPKRRADIDRAKSHEVTSGAAAGAVPAVSTERLQEMVELLQGMGDVEQQEVIDLINEEAKEVDEEGEIELNFEKVTPEALHAMDMYFRRKMAPAAAPARSTEVASGRQQRAGSVRLEVGSDSEPESDDGSEYNSDDD